MRKDNIKRIISLLERVWQQSPDQRLCQLIVNVSNSNDPFYIEDAAFETALQEVVKD